MTEQTRNPAATGTRTVHTYCRICEPTCGLVATVDQEERVTLRPDRSHPVHQGFACHKGLNFTEIHLSLIHI